jgi:hypothetical protein
MKKMMEKKIVINIDEKKCIELYTKFQDAYSNINIISFLETCIVNQALKVDGYETLFNNIIDKDFVNKYRNKEEPMKIIKEKMIKNAM